MKKLFIILFFSFISILYAQEFELISEANEQMILVNHSGQDDTFRIKIHMSEGVSANETSHGFKLNANSGERFATYATYTLTNNQTKRVPGDFDWTKIDCVKVESKSGNKYTLNFYTRWDNLYVEILPYEDW
ncbi:hypothetical protein [Treponema bryantii]|uniref:hypothetical protein n=1 Tax=Treponema bryantii TaxID=163 RepID=UPI0003B6A455|nr:hypothetical protein [Treponema bryantii]